MLTRTFVHQDKCESGRLSLRHHYNDLTTKILKRKLPIEFDSKKATVEDTPIFEPTPSKFGQDGGVSKVKEFIDANVNNTTSTSISQPMSIEIRDEGSLERLARKHKPKIRHASQMHRQARNNEVVGDMKTYHVSLIS